MQDLIDTWKKGKEALSTNSSAEALITLAKQKKRSVLYAQYGNVLVLTISLVGLTLFFIFVAPFQTLLSHIGMGMMLGGLALRIGIEIASIVKSGAIQLSSDATEATKAAFLFYHFRKRVHGHVTIAIAGVYAVGFYFLTPEFSQYISFQWMVLMHLSFLLGGAFLIWVIKKGIKKEMGDLVQLTSVRNEITAEGGNHAGQMQ
ncbi:MAG TPA: hypothetical protein VMR70_09385 [Flavisolibacter sp.]|nr:hypothetical protein [Flavisolibacter sp.]